MSHPGPATGGPLGRKIRTSLQLLRREKIRTEGQKEEEIKGARIGPVSLALMRFNVEMSSSFAGNSVPLA